MNELTIAFTARDETGKRRIVVLKTPIDSKALQLAEVNGDGKELPDGKTAEVARAVLSDDTGNNMVVFGTDGRIVLISLQDVRALGISVTNSQ